MFVGCGKCVGCLLEDARQWAVRCVHETKMHAESCSILATYDPKSLPADLSLVPEHFVGFLKRLRERLRWAEKPPISFFMCGEYGETNSRPHYHSLLFGFTPPDAVFYRTTKAGSAIFTSDYLSDVWSHGVVHVGACNFESAAYIARYQLKKPNYDKTEMIDVFTGELIRRVPEYRNMSTKPAIGKRWLDKYKSDLYPRDGAIVNGRRQNIPRYYDVKYAEEHPEEMDAIKAARCAKADLKYDRLRLEAKSEGRNEYVPEDVFRSRTEEIVKRAAIRALKRS